MYQYQIGIEYRICPFLNNPKQASVAAAKSLLDANALIFKGELISFR